MPRLSPAIALLLALLPAAVAAGPVSSFDVRAAASLTLTDATSATDGTDLFDSLTITYSLDPFDDFPQSSGNAGVTTDFDRDDAAGAVAASANGWVQGPFGSASARVNGRLTQTITNTSAGAVDLLFTYVLSLEGTAVGSLATALGSAFVELQDFAGQVFYREIPGLSTPPQGFEGQTTFRLGAGETLYASAFAEIYGDAFAFDGAPVPLPGALPLALGAVGALALVARRRRRA